MDLAFKPWGQKYIYKELHFFANFEKDGLPVLYDNNFERDVIGSRMVSTILNFKAADSVANMELTDKFFHEEVGLVTHKNLAIILKIRAKLVTFHQS